MVPSLKHWYWPCHWCRGWKKIDIEIAIDIDDKINWHWYCHWLWTSITIDIAIDIDIKISKNWHWHCHWNWCWKIIEIAIDIGIEIFKKLTLVLPLLLRGKKNWHWYCHWLLACCNYWNWHWHWKEICKIIDIAIGFKILPLLMSDPDPPILTILKNFLEKWRKIYKSKKKIVGPKCFAH